MTKFFKDKLYDFGFLSIKEECAKFCLSSRGSNQFENSADDVNGAIDLNWRIIMENTAEEEVATCLTASFRGTEVRGIRMHIEHNVRSTISHGHAVAMGIGSCRGGGWLPMTLQSI